MARKRRAAAGDGSLYQRESDGRWVGCFKVGAKRKYVYGKTQREAREKLRKAQQDVGRGMLVESSRLKTDDYLRHWIEVHSASIGSTSAVMYRSHVENHIIPALGHIPLQKLTVDTIQAFYASLSNAKLGSSTIRVIHTVFKAALADAVEWEKIGRNPCDRVKLPRNSKREMQVLNQEQTQALLHAVQGHKLECLVTLALTTGMRKGELLALHWSDIDLERKVVQIRHTLTYVARRGLKESEPKTKASRRSIVLADAAVEALKRHRTHQIEQRWKAGEKWVEQGLVFSNSLGKHMWSGHIYKWFKRLLQDAELPVIRFHDLRHSAATALLIMKVQPKVVQEILGHSSIAITMDIYSHVLPGIQQEAMAQMDRFLCGKQAVENAM